MRVAEDAKGIILTWSKWLVGLAVVGLSLFGVASYESIGTKIDQKIAGQKIEEKIVAEIDKREGKMKAFQEGQQKLYIDSAVTGPVDGCGAAGVGFPQEHPDTPAGLPCGR